MGLARASALLAIISATVPVNASDCFCLVDTDDNFRHSCEQQQQGIRTVYLCQASDDLPIKMSNLDGWQQLQNGEGRCQPCRQIRDDPNPAGGIRGSDKPQNADE